VVTTGTPGKNWSYVRLLFDHFDPETGVHYVFAGVATGLL
jgi:hypothetical protein